MTRYDDFIARKRRQYGELFSEHALSPAFRRYYESGERIEVRTSYGETMRGTVGVTTGWWPVFILLPRRDSISSSTVLHDNDTVVGVVRPRR